MTRRVVIGILIFLILGVLGGIVVLSISWLQAPPEEIVVTPTPIPINNPTADTDNDGLTNADEKLWGTNPSNSDTDGDKYLDGEEVRKSHNPTIASPNDKLPPGFQPNQNVIPTNPTNPTATSFESYFSESVDVTGGSKNLSQEYARTVPDKEKTSVSLTQFVQAQPITTTLPAVNESAITVEQDNPIALSHYMSTAGNLDPISDQTRVTLAVTAFVQNHHVTGFATLADRVAGYEKELMGLSVPTSALEYHKLLIGYSELLAGTFRQIYGYQNDQVRSLVALRQLDAIDRQYYPIILKERSKLIDLAQQ